MSICIYRMAVLLNYPKATVCSYLKEGVVSIGLVQADCFFTSEDKIPVFKVRMYKHLRVPTHTGKESREDNDSAIKGYLPLFCSDLSGFDDLSIIASNNNDFKVTLIF